MAIRKIGMIIFLFLISGFTAFANPDSNFGQSIHITTQFDSYIGNPTWFLEIRDVDHNQTIPYLFPINRKTNIWVAYTFSRNYLITASQITFPRYQSRYNSYQSFKLKNFCHLESFGRIIHNQSIQIQVSGRLTPNANTVRCTKFVSP